MNCNVKGCPGQYQEQCVNLAEEMNEQIVLVRNVPAQVCDFCGDVLTTWDTMAQVTAFLASNPPVISTTSVYEFASQWTPRPLDDEPVGAGKASANGHYQR